jgi:hypothetical protein
MRRRAKRISFESKFDRAIYLQQNKAIHRARLQLSLDINDCRRMAEEISGRASLSSLSLEERWTLIEQLKDLGAEVGNPFLSKRAKTSQPTYQNDLSFSEEDGSTDRDTYEGLYSKRSAYWEQRFPSKRIGFASPKQLALIEALWEVYFNDKRPGRGLRGFVWRQTAHFEDGPISALPFIKGHHVSSILGPLKAKRNEGGI